MFGRRNNDRKGAQNNTKKYSFKTRTIIRQARLINNGKKKGGKVNRKPIFKFLPGLSLGRVNPGPRKLKVCRS